jgi:hypothetical protein
MAARRSSSVTEIPGPSLLRCSNAWDVEPIDIDAGQGESPIGTPPARVRTMREEPDSVIPDSPTVMGHAFEGRYEAHQEKDDDLAYTTSFNFVEADQPTPNATCTNTPVYSEPDDVFSDDAENALLDQCKSLDSLRDDLPVLLLSCFRSDNLKSADYNHLPKILEALSRVPITGLGGSLKDHLPPIQLEHVALDIWTEMMEMFCKFRQDTGFHGDKDAWETYRANLDRPERLVATLPYAEMRRFYSKLRRKCAELSAENVGKSVAARLWEIAGQPNFISLEDWTYMVCALCSELFVWFDG